MGPRPIPRRTSESRPWAVPGRLSAGGRCGARVGYDVVLASRKDTAVKLFEKANPVPKVEPPATLFDLLG
jgi:hypothetical protein